SPATASLVTVTERSCVPIEVGVSTSAASGWVDRNALPILTSNVVYTIMGAMDVRHFLGPSQPASSTSPPKTSHSSSVPSGGNHAADSCVPMDSTKSWLLKQSTLRTDHVIPQSTKGDF
ncbi:MAG: hypothetical protein ACI9MC_000821, partial [Kiritimatiellia bacterium]